MTTLEMKPTIDKITAIIEPTPNEQLGVDKIPLTLQKASLEQNNKIKLTKKLKTGINTEPLAFAAVISSKEMEKSVLLNDFPKTPKEFLRKFL